MFSPLAYSEVVGSYSAEARKLTLWILDLVGEGLGLESGYFRDELSQVQFMSINHYPRCPDPSLTLGLPKHCDPNLITLVLQGEVHGLQVFKDGQWLAVEPLPNAFVVNIGYMLQVHPIFPSSSLYVILLPFLANLRGHNSYSHV